MRHAIAGLLLLAACAALARDARAQDGGADADAGANETAYFVATLDALAFPLPRDRGDGLPTGTREDVLRASQRASPHDTGFVRDFFMGTTSPPPRPPRVLLDGPGEGLIVPAGEPELRFFGRVNPPRPVRLAVRLDRPRDVFGRLLVPDATGSGHVAVEFAVPAVAFRADARNDWLRAMADAASVRIVAGDTGAAWFRHVRAAALAELGETAPALTRDDHDFWVRGGNGELEQIGLFSGGRALSENLALDRLLPLSPVGADSVLLETVPGVTVADYAWGPFIEGLSPARDPLAALVPADQHGVFFPSIEAALTVLDEFDALAAVFEGSTGIRLDDAGTRERYERQLGLKLDELAQKLGPLLVKSVALTGGDPYLRLGSDLALLFEPRQGALAQAAITAAVLARLGTVPGVERDDEVVEGVACTVLRSVDRSASSWIGEVGGIVVVANSPVQIARLARVARGEEPALADTPEYTFFRHRYGLGDPAESALVVVTDATIRRWSGPRLRIGSARRARAAAALGEVTARHLAEPGPAAGASADARVLPAPESLPSLGPLVRLSSGRIHSPVWGNLDFATPIGELDLERVTSQEADLYANWRRGYERGWQNEFDPIAIRIGVGAGGRLSTDLTVRPLRVDSDYREFIRFTQGGSVAPHAGDLHPGTLIQFVLGLRSGAVTEVMTSGFFSPVGFGARAFDWIGSSVSVYFDVELPSGDAAEAPAPLRPELKDQPVALQVEVGNAFMLATFLTMVRGLVEGSAPGLIAWENRDHAGIGYVRAYEREAGPDEGISVYYYASPEQLTVSPSDALIRRVIERHVARAAARAAGEPTLAETERPWLGQHVGLRLDVPAAVATLAQTGDPLHLSMQEASWSNLHILNVWRRLFPDRDPVALHEAVFARRPVCPGGGGYRWNGTWQTMESVVYGHPGAPLPGPALPPVVERAGFLRLGLSFEDDGLRAQVELEPRAGPR